MIRDEATRRSHVRSVSFVLIPTMCLLVPSLLLGQAPKKKITRAADVPQFQYSISGKVEDLVRSADAFRVFAAQIRTNVESILREYDIEDASTKRGLLEILASLDLLEHQDTAARQRLDEVKALEEKPATRALSGLIPRAILDARRDVPDLRSPAYDQALDWALKRLLEGLPFELVQNDLRAMKARTETITEAVVIGFARASFDPVVEKTGGLSADLAHVLAAMRMDLAEGIPHKAVVIEALAGYLSAHTKARNNIWADREVALEAGKYYPLVNVAVWDTGVDLAIFKNVVLRDASGEPAVLAYDNASRKTAGSLYHLSAEQASRWSEGKKQLKGMIDIQTNMESPDARNLRGMLATLKPNEVGSFLEESRLFSLYAHGTHVAGILAAGNPYARVATAVLSRDSWKMVPSCPSQARVERETAAWQDYVGFFVRNQVRVVNMSWAFEGKVFEEILEKCGRGDTRTNNAREWFDLEKAALQRALRSAPDILFVAAAGNSNANSTFNDVIPPVSRFRTC
jgi:Subtilase family